MTPTIYQPSDALVAFLKTKEACAEWNDTLQVFMPYPDSGGISTIGWGHKLTYIDITSGIFEHGLSQAGCDLLFLQDLKPVVRYVNNLSIAKTQGEFDALVDIDWNVGFKATRILKSLGIADPKNWLHFVHDARGVVLPGLVSRRQQNIAWFFNIPLDEVKATYSV